MSGLALRELVGIVEAATPPDRDRAVDVLRAVAIGGVVLGHWLVTALVADSGTVSGASPLRYLPPLAPVSWLFQTLAVFFLVGGLVATRGYARARARGVPYRTWLAIRMARLFRPVVVVLVVWGAVAGLLLASGVDPRTVMTLMRLILSPLWFLLVFTVLTAATPLVAKLHPGWPLALVGVVDILRLGLGTPHELGWVNVAAGWLVPYTLGAAWAQGRLNSRAAGWALLTGGAATTGALIGWAGYPASMVGIPGADFSNLDPPSLAAVTFGLAQCGVAGLLLGPLRRLMLRPVAWTVTTMVNLSAMTIFLWHQTAMIAVTALGLLAGRPLPGLHTVPDSTGWVVARLGWLPLFVLALLVCHAAFHTYERTGRRVDGAGPSTPTRATSTAST